MVYKRKQRRGNKEKERKKEADRKKRLIEGKQTDI